MRIPYTDEMRELEKKITPYRVQNGMKIELAKDTPEEIREAEKRFFELFKEQEKIVMESIYSTEELKMLGWQNS